MKHLLSYDLMGLNKKTGFLRSFIASSSVNISYELSALTLSLSTNLLHDS